MEAPQCPGCRKRDARIAKLEAEVAELHTLLGEVPALMERIRDLEARLGQNSSNSSLPPSANPPHAPPPVRKKATDRKPGGQPGHPPHLRERLPADRLTEPPVHYWPEQCEACQHDLPAVASPDDPEPRWHQ